MKKIYLQSLAIAANIFKRSFCFPILITVAFAVSNSHAQELNNIASSIGINSYCTGQYGNGVSFFDWDSDGFDDIVLLDDQYAVQFYKNTNGLFELVELPGVEVTGHVKSVNWVDINNDKEPDLAFNLAPGTFKLFLNTGSFNFTDVSATCGIEQIVSMGYGQAWGDYDKDGYVDLYICNYQTIQISPQRTNYLYHNNQDGTFTNVTDIAGVGNGYKTTFIATWVDYDKDSWPDLFVYNDRYQFTNALYKNNGDGTFSDVSTSAGFDGAYEPMSGSVGDFNNDGNLDIYTTNTQGNKLYQNTGSGTFNEVAAANNAQMFIFTWGACWIDMDGDKKEDLIVASAEPFGNYNNIYYLHNSGSGFETAQNYGFSQSFGETYALASGDINNDGKQEILGHGLITSGTQIWQNDVFQYQYLKINLNGVVSNKDGIGAWIEAYSNETIQTRYTLSGEQYLGQNSQWEFFGFQNEAIIDSLIIRWPSGIIDKFMNIETNQALTIAEGESLTCTITAMGSLTPCEGDSVILDAGIWDSYLWNDGSTDRYYTVTSDAECYVTVQFGDMELGSDVIYIHYVDASDYTLTNVSGPCAMNSDGSITLEVQDENAATIELVLWNNSIESTQFQVMPNTMVNYSFSAGNACLVEGMSMFEPMPEFSVLVNPMIADAFSPCPNEWYGVPVVSNGQSPYSYEWRFYYPGQTDPFLEHSDSYFSCITTGTDISVSLKVADANQCEFVYDFMLMNPVSSEAISSDSQLNIRPNPFQDKLELSPHVDVLKVNLFDLSGRLQQHFTLQPNETTIQTSQIAKGIYFIEVMDENTKKVKRFVKQ